MDIDIPLTKKQVRDSVPKRIRGLQFGALSAQEIVDQGVIEISDRNPYDYHHDVRVITPHGPLDSRMGVSQNSKMKCATCDREPDKCNGHFGYVRLALPCLHVGYLKKTLDILNCVCKECASVLLDETDKRNYLVKLGIVGLSGLDKAMILDGIVKECKKRDLCPKCNTINGIVKKVTGHPLKLVHDKFRKFNASTAKGKQAPKSKVNFDASFAEAKKTNQELERHVRKALDDLNPLRVLNLFKMIAPADYPLFGMHEKLSRPESLIWQFIPAPPVQIRPSVAQDQTSTEDDITNKLGDIIMNNQIIRAGIEKGQPINTIMEQWDHLQTQIGIYINSDTPNLQPGDRNKQSFKSFCTRLKGKQGRFRGNLSGKRVEFSGRTVISPDPNLSIDEVAVPRRVAQTLTYPEKVNMYNIDKLRRCVANGRKHPGATTLYKKNLKRKANLEPLNSHPRGVERLKELADNIEVGDIVERHLEDGDIVLFNRQPSLHRLSIMCHRVKVREWRTFRLNECVCTPYNADFDGDEMNLHVPQTEEARTEALELMGVKHNLQTPKDGTPIIAAIQDFITAAYLLSNKDRFYDRKTFSQICSYMLHANAVRDPVDEDVSEHVSSRKGYLDIDLPQPAILKPEMLWTGKQIFNVLMRPSRKSNVLVNLDVACKTYTAAPGVPPDLNEEDAWLCVRNSEVMCGVMDKATMGSGRKDSIFYVIARDYGPDCAVQAMNRMARLSARWLSNEGFSVGINDVYPGANLVQEKSILVAHAYAQCDELIQDYKEGKLARDAGCNAEQTMENRISGILSKTRQKAGQLCFQELSKWNSPIIMAKSGSKGSDINVSQMVAAVGQQIIGGQRVADGFQDRTLPHFPKASRQPPSKGFVRNSFFSGLNPTEFLFHAMSGREGLVDTAVKTAETGYMSRRLMKSLEDMSSQYDNSVRASTSEIVQFQYGDDKLDPLDMEGKAKPVNFERAFLHAVVSQWTNSDNSLTPNEAKVMTNKMLEPWKAPLKRTTILGQALDYDDSSLFSTDQYESDRNFIREIEQFLGRKIDALERAQRIYSSNMPAPPQQPKKKGRKSAATKKAEAEAQAQMTQTSSPDGVAKISQKSLNMFIDLCMTKFRKAHVEPGLPVGAIGSHSIGEPGTQMTLKTFHFAGVAGMSITQGVPRIKEIINASRSISTPVITCALLDEESTHAARIVKGRIERTHLKDVLSWIEEAWDSSRSYIRMLVDVQRIQDLQLDVTMSEIQRSISDHKPFKLEDHQVRLSGQHITVVIEGHGSESRSKSRGRASRSKEALEDPFLRAQTLKRMLPHVPIKGYPQATRAVITRSPGAENSNRVVVEGYGLRSCMATPGVDAYRTTTNAIMETREVLGIEAARASIIKELQDVMGTQMDIDPRHIQLLADVMTFKGMVLGITRFGLAKMRDSVLHLASFEKTPDQLFNAATHTSKDGILGVSECIIMGQTMPVGTGSLRVIKALGLQDEDFRKKATAFDDCFKDVFEMAK